MNRRSFLSCLVSLPFMGWAVAKALAAPKPDEQRPKVWSQGRPNTVPVEKRHFNPPRVIGKSVTDGHLIGIDLAEGSDSYCIQRFDGARWRKWTPDFGPVPFSLRDLTPPDSPFHSHSYS